jgi:hypothetical protein
MKNLTNNFSFTITKKPCHNFFVTMLPHNREEGRLECINNQEPPRNRKHQSESNSTTQVLETMRNLIMELQIFKDDNENLKKSHEYQQKVNKTLLWDISTKKSPKNNEVDEEVSKKSSKYSSHGT